MIHSSSFSAPFRRGGAALLCVLFLVLASRPGYSQSQYLPDYAMRALDSALGRIRMTQADLRMRWDAAADDPHRLSAIKRLFGDPLATFSLSDSIASQGLAGEQNYTEFLGYLGLQLDLGPRAFTFTRPQMNDRDIFMYSKVNLNTLDYNRALILRRFLALALSTDAAVLSARNELTEPRLRRLLDYADSLVIQGEGSEEASLVELKIAERYALQRGRQFFNEDAKGLDYAHLLDPGVTMFAGALEMARAMAPEIVKMRDSVKTQIWETPLGLVAVGGPGDDFYTGDFFCIIDVGGNDIYRPSRPSKAQAFEQSATLIVDFAGNDTYIGGDYTFGGTVFGASTLIDMEGNDNYSVRNFGLGAGLFGTGILYDGAGSDRYSGGSAVQGAGMFGIGLLIDAKGNDNYSAEYAAQGFGFTRGVGMIVEHEGNDNYLVTSPYADFLRYDDHYETMSQGAAFGYRPLASAGIGVIAEGGGNDIYVCDIFGQGTAYWFGLGAIVDKLGNDSYTAYQYAQGSGVHLAFGALIDESGHDNYVSHGVSQGCGHDVAFGGLYDAKGDDNYVVESLSLGGGNANAISLFVDGGGEDGYLARRSNTLGYSDLRRDYSMIGIFLDLEKKDFYGTSRGGNDSLWTGSYYGTGLDGEFRPAELSEAGPSGSAIPQKSKEEIEAELASDLPTLFIQASAAPQKYQYIVEPARNRLVERSQESFPFLLNQFDSESARERLALGIIIPRMGSSVVPRLIDTVLYGESKRVGMAIYALGELRDTSAAMALGRKLVDSNASWRMRSSAGEALLKMPSHGVKPYLRQALRDSFELVRGYAARALTMVADSSDFELLTTMLYDSSQIVRNQVYLALERRGVDSLALPFAGALVGNRRGIPYELLYGLAPSLKDSIARIRIVEGMLADTLPSVRAAALRLIRSWNDTALVLRTLEMRQTENNSMVLYELDRLPEISKETLQKIEKERKRLERDAAKLKKKQEAEEKKKKKK